MGEGFCKNFTKELSYEVHGGLKYCVEQCRFKEECDRYAYSTGGPTSDEKRRIARNIELESADKKEAKSVSSDDLEKIKNTERFCKEFIDEVEWKAYKGENYCESICEHATSCIIHLRNKFGIAPVEGRKDDTGKDRWDLVPWEQLEQVVKVLTFGAQEYDDNNWKQVDKPEDRYFAALHRHLVAYRKGESLDPKSKLPHLAHAACNALFLLWFEAQK